MLPAAMPISPTTPSIVFIVTARRPGHARDTFGRWRDDDVPRLAPAARAVPRRCRYQYAHRLQFCGIFSDDDLDALAKFDAIQISFDSADTQMVRKLRSKADLRTIAFNIIQLRQRARELGRTLSLVVNCTLWRDNIGGIAKLAGFCRELGIDQLLLTEGFISTAHNYTVPDTLDTLKNDDILLFAQQILAAEALLSDCGTSLRLQDHLRSRIGELLEEVRNGEKPQNAIASFHHR